MNIPEGKVNRDLLYVMRKIKEGSLREKAEAPIQYWVYPNIVSIGGDIPTSGNQIKALEKLEELRTIRILNPGGTGEYE